MVSACSSRPRTRASSRSSSLTRCTKGCSGFALRPRFLSQGSQVALLAPLAQRRGIEAVSPKELPDLSWLRGRIGCPQDLELVGRGEATPAGLGRNLRVRGQRTLRRLAARCPGDHSAPRDLASLAPSPLRGSRGNDLDIRVRLVLQTALTSPPSSVTPATLSVPAMLAQRALSLS